MVTYISGEESGLTPVDRQGYEYIVRYEDAPDEDALDAFRAAVGAELVKTTQRWGFELWRSDTQITAELLAEFEDADWYGEVSSCVTYVQDNLAIDAASFSSDPRDDDLWAFENADDTDIDVPEAWENSRGAGVIVAVIDTGVDYTHPDLAANMWRNLGEIAGNGIDDDGNGYVDDVYGYDFANTDADPMDGHSHGTHVAGTIAAVADNGIGVAGVAPEAQIMAIKIMSDSGSGSIFDAIQGIEYAAMMGAQIANASWGGSGYSQALADAILLANEESLAIVAAAGNDATNTDYGPHYPSSIDAPNIISVAATSKDGGLASFSNYGIVSVDVTAPGSQILSTVPGATYGVKSGTSMATPHVSGVAALILANEPTLSPEELRERLIETSDPVAALASRSVSGGRVNAATATETELLSAISGRVTEDGVGLAGWTVFLDSNGDGKQDTGESATVTDANGAYRFEGLSRGSYVVAAILAPGYLPADEPAAYYRVSEEIIPWNALDGVGRRYDLGDEGSVRLALPFDVEFFGHSFDALTITANGFLAFGIPGRTFVSKDMAEAPAFSISPYWADLSTVHGGQVRVLREADQITILYDGVRGYSGAGKASFAVTIQSDGDIVFSYGDMSDAPSGAHIGLRGQNSSEAVTVTTLPATGAVRFTTKPQTVATVEVEADRAESVAEAIEVSDQAEVLAEYSEIGQLSRQQQWIAFDREFIDPVVFLLAADGSVEPTALTARVLSTSATGFYAALQSADAISAAASSQSFGYLVIEAGRWQLADGTMLEVGHYDTARLSSSGFDKVEFGQGFTDAPLVFSQVQTAMDADYVRTRQNGSTETGFALALEEDEANNLGSHGQETVGWLAIDAVSGGASGIEAAEIGSNFNAASFDFGSGFLNTPMILTSLATARGADPAQTVVTGISANSVSVTVQEDQASDAETEHADESVNFLALAGDGTLSGYRTEGQSIGGAVWLDTDGDGLRDAGEAGLADQLVWLDTDRDGQRDATEQFVVTDTNGQYQFEGVAAGAWQVRHELSQGWVDSGITSAAGYSGSEVDYTWAVAPGDAVLIQGLGDDGSAIVDLPFLFPFFGVGRENVTVSANGYLSFGGDGELTQPGTFGDAEAGAIIAAFWNDLTIETGSVRVWNDADSEAFFVEYRNVAHYSTDDRATFQLRLDADGTISVHYKRVDDGFSGVGIGVADGAGAVVELDELDLTDGFAFCLTPVEVSATPQEVVLGVGEAVTDVDFGTKPTSEVAMSTDALESNLMTAMIAAAETVEDLYW